MNDRQLEKKIQRDTAKLKKDLNTLMANSTSQLSEGFEKLTDEAKETVVSAAATVKKDIGHGLSQFNAKAHDLANKVPGDLGKQVAKYPWVAISIGLLIGLIVGGLLKPSRQS
jgi:ElaB/YqjD/DUF883 family membrane-anchored ribosome-binding protein